MSKDILSEVPRKVKPKRQCRMKCDATWHLRRLDCPPETKALAIAIYFRSLQLTAPDEEEKIDPSYVREFFVPMDELCAYYNAHWTTVQAALKVLKDSGWFLCGPRGGLQELADGTKRYARNPKTGRIMATVYVPYTHKQWASQQQHEGQCLEDTRPTAGRVRQVLPQAGCGKSYRRQGAVQSSTVEASTEEATTEATAGSRRPAVDSARPFRPKSKPLAGARHGEGQKQCIGKPDDWVPLDEMRELVFEASGIRPYFPRPYLRELKKLAEECGPSALVEAVRLSLREITPETFEWEKFPSWFMANGRVDALLSVVQYQRRKPPRENGQPQWKN